MTSIREDDDLKFVTIAGDNIYSHQKSKPPRYSVAKLKDGLRCLKTMEKPMVNVLGNHDIADSSRDFEITRLQLRPSGERGGWGIDPDPLWVKQFPEVPNSVFIGIDTNFLVRYTRVEAYGRDTDREMVYRKMLAKLVASTLDPSKNVFMLGHIPIVSIVPDVKIEDIHVSKLDVMFKDILDILSDKGLKSVHYLCADTHSYQDILLEYTSPKTQETIQVRQIISGTGGAKMQKFPSDPSVFGSGGISRLERIISNPVPKHRRTIISGATILGITHGVHGYAKISINSETQLVSEIKFIPVADAVSEEELDILGEKYETGDGIYNPATIALPPAPKSAGAWMPSFMPSDVGSGPAIPPVPRRR